MTEKDKKEFRLMMGEVLELVVLPQIQEIRDDVKVLKGDVKVLKEKVNDLEDTTNRIELKLDTEITRQDKLSKRVEHLEKICVK